MAKSQEDGITILPGLKGHEVGKVSEDEEEIMVTVSVRQESTNCPCCGSMRLYRHGSCQERKVLHSWRGGKRIYLAIHRHRWRCRECSRSFNDEVKLLRSYSRITRQAEVEVLWQLKERSFSQVRKEMGVGYGTVRRLLEREIDEEALGFRGGEEEIFLGIDEHSFRHQEVVHTVTEVKKRRVLGILRDDRRLTLKEFLSKIPGDKVKEVCIDMKEGLRKAVEAVFPEARVVIDHFHMVADSNRRMDEARRIEQDVHHKRKVKIPKKILLVGREKLSKEKVRELYRQESLEEATRTLDNIIFNLRLADDGELIRWGNSLKRWREPILNHFDNRTTNGFTEGCNTKIKMLKRVSYGIRNVEVYWRKMLLGFVPSRSYFHTI